jgi:hypothetical protein
MNSLLFFRCLGTYEEIIGFWKVFDGFSYSRRREVSQRGKMGIKYFDG